MLVFLFFFLFFRFCEFLWSLSFYIGLFSLRVMVSRCASVDHNTFEVFDSKLGERLIEFRANPDHTCTDRLWFLVIFGKHDISRNISKLVVLNISSCSTTTNITSFHARETEGILHRPIVHHSFNEPRVNVDLPPPPSVLLFLPILPPPPPPRIGVEAKEEAIEITRTEKVN